MGSIYQVLIDPIATPATAVERATRIRDRLIEREIIQPNLDPDCVLAGSGHRPGRALADLYPPSKHSFGGRTCGVEFMPRRYINDFGWIVFQHAICPICERRHGPQEIQDPLFQAIGAFLDGADSPSMTCPASRQSIDVHRWQMRPPMGFCHLQIRF